MNTRSDALQRLRELTQRIRQALGPTRAAPPGQPRASCPRLRKTGNSAQRETWSPPPRHWSEVDDDESLPASRGPTTLDSRETGASAGTSLGRQRPGSPGQPGGSDNPE